MNEPEIAYYVIPKKEDKAKDKWVKIGSLYTNENSKKLILDAMPLGREIVILAAKPKPTGSEASSDAG